jgi:hypothetical protein
MRELISNDNDSDPSPALGDLQYVVFNTIAVLYFLGAFLGHIERGLPTLPGSLIALTGVSAASYLASKTATQSAAPTVISAVPSTVVLGSAPTPVTVSGTGFIPDGIQGTPSVTIGGIPLQPAAGNIASATQITADVPTTADAARVGLTAGTYNVVVVTPVGTPSTSQVTFVVVAAAAQT